MNTQKRLIEDALRLARQYGRGYADGGSPVDDMAPQPAAPEVDPTVALAQQTLAAPRPRFKIKSSGAAPAAPEQMGGYEFQKLQPGRANTNSLKEAFNRGLERHLSLPESERIANSKAAIRTLEPYLGTREDGSPIALFTKNRKLMKAEAGTKNTDPLMLDDGRGVETTGLSLYPDYREGDFKMCANSASCRDNCLGQTSGQYKYAGKDGDKMSNDAHKAAMNRTMAMMREPEAFAIRLWDDIESARRQAAAKGNHLGVRLNTLSDVNPIVHKMLIESQPDVSFFDYTKMKYKPVAENHHYTYSSTGVDHEDAANPHSNWRSMRRLLDWDEKTQTGGNNVAMAFSHKNKLPSFVHDEETGKRYRVVSGDEHDFRPLDMQPEGEDGVIVGLKNKDGFGKQETAHKDSNGFFVHYDPKRHGDTVHIRTQPKKGI